MFNFVISSGGVTHSLFSRTKIVSPLTICILPTDDTTCHYWVMKLASVPYQPSRVSQSTRKSQDQRRTHFKHITKHISHAFCLAEKK